MIMLLDTSTALCKLTFIIENNRHNFDWQADRNLASGLLRFLDEKLKSINKSWSDINAIGVFKGPGSFTGLRIGLTVINTIADAQNIPIVGGRGDNWQDEVISKIKSNINEKIVLPYYGSEAHITVSKK